MAFLHLPPIRWLTSFYNPPKEVLALGGNKLITVENYLNAFSKKLPLDNVSLPYKGYDK